MTSTKILFLNLGYARGIDGHLSSHLRHANRHFYCSPATQLQSLTKLKALIRAEQPDICCIVEIEKGNASRANSNQMHALIGSDYPFADIENKYAQKSYLRSFGPMASKANGFLSRKAHQFERLFFKHGTKKLIYKIKLTPSLTLFFAHFSLRQKTRARQILEARNLMRDETADVMFLGDFNVLNGLEEIKPLLDAGGFVLLNDASTPTFRLHKQLKILDLCVCSPSLAKRTTMRIEAQPFTDHAALIVSIDNT